MTLNERGVWNEYDPTGKLTGNNYVSKFPIPNPIFTEPVNLRPILNTRRHGVDRNMYCSDCGF